MFNANDFYYDGQFLSDYGFIIGSYGGEYDGKVTINPGSKITFNKVSRNSGKRFSMVSAKYAECYSASFTIVKEPFAPITNDEYRDLMRLLNRREFLQTYFIEHNDEESETVYYNASFTVEKEYDNFKLVALRLTMETDSPFGYGQEQTATFTISDTEKFALIADINDEIGYTYPDLSITINKNGDLELYNEDTACRTVIKNCVVGEVITIDGNAKIISTSKDAHKATLHNDFNFEFFKIGNTIDNKSNHIYSTLPCKCVLRYKPIIK